MILNRKLSLIALISLVGINFLNAHSTQDQVDTKTKVGISVTSMQEFDQLVNTSDVPTLVQFHSGCPVCKKTGLTIRRIVSQHSDLQFLEVDINNLNELAQRYSIASLPTVLIFPPNNNSPQYKIVDPNEEKLETSIAAACQKK